MLPWQALTKLLPTATNAKADKNRLTEAELTSALREAKNWTDVAPIRIPQRAWRLQPCGDHRGDGVLAGDAHAAALEDGAPRVGA